MTTINNLSTIDSVAGGDQVPVYDTSAGTARKMSVSQLLAFFTANFASPDYTVTISSPIDGFNQQLAAATDSIWLLLTPAGTLATGTVTLPPVADLYDGQEVLVTSTAEITTLTVAGNGATVSGAPAALAADGFFRLRYNLLLTTWYTVAQSLGSAQTVFTSLEVDNLTLNTAILDSNGNELLKVLPVASAVNELTIFNGPTGDGVGFSATGDDTDIDINFVTKGTGGAYVNGDEILTDAVAATGTGQRVLATQPGILFAVLTAPILVPGTFAAIDAFRALYELTDDATGMRATCTDAAATRASGIAGNTNVAGGGANLVPIWYDGTNWKY